MKQDSWQPRRRVEQDYYADILKMLRRVFERGDLLDASQFVAKFAWQAAQRMIVGLLHDGAKTWRQAARESMQGRRIHSFLASELRGPVGERVRQLIASNAQLISSLPEQIREEAALKIAEIQQAGLRPEVAEKELLAHTSRVRAQLIARTESQKASTALVRSRSEDIGVEWWMWQTSQDQRVRQSHRKMQGVLCSWSDLPSPEQLVGEKSAGHYAAGDIYNCRCYPEPVLDLRQLRFPHRLYASGRIRMVSKAEFRNIARIPQPIQEAA